MPVVGYASWQCCNYNGTHAIAVSGVGIRPFWLGCIPVSHDPSSAIEWSKFSTSTWCNMVPLVFDYQPGRCCVQTSGKFLTPCTLCPDRPFTFSDTVAKWVSVSGWVIINGDGGCRQQQPTAGGLTTAQVGWLGLKICSHVAQSYIHQMNRVNSRNYFSLCQHNKRCPGYYYYCCYYYYYYYYQRHH